MISKFTYDLDRESKQSLSLLIHQTWDRVGTLTAVLAAVAATLSKAGAEQLGGNELIQTSVSGGWPGNPRVSWSFGLYFVSEL